MLRRLQELRNWMNADRWLAAVPLTFAALVYARVTRVYFISDDFVDMVNIANRGWLHFLVAPFGGHMIFTRNVEVILMNTLFGFEHPAAYGFLALATHLVNVHLFNGAVKGATRSPALGALGATVWGGCPIFSDAIAWFSVYGQVLCGTSLLLLFRSLITRHVTEEPVTSRTALKWGAFILLGATCFGGGIAVALAFPVVLFVLFDRKAFERRALAVAVLTPVVVLVLYYGWHFIYALYEPLPEDERRLQGIAFRSLKPPFQMLGYLVSISVSAMARGFAFTPSSYPSVLWVVVIAAWSLLWVGFVLGSAGSKRRLTALCLFAGAIYGMVALGRANIYGMFGISPYEAARQLRYHYAGSIPVALALTLAFGEIARWKWLSDLPGVAFAGFTLANAYSFASSDWEIPTHDDCRTFMQQLARTLEERVEAVPRGGDVYVPNDPLPVYCTVFMGYNAIPGPAAIYIVLHPEDDWKGRRLHFVESEAFEGLYDNPRNTRLSRLLVPP